MSAISNQHCRLAAFAPSGARCL